VSPKLTALLDALRGAQRGRKLPWEDAGRLDYFRARRTAEERLERLRGYFLR
jgi:hypothetical protein